MEGSAETKSWVGKGFIVGKQLTHSPTAGKSRDDPEIRM